MKIAVLCSNTTSLFWFRMDMMKKFVELGHDVIAVGDEPVHLWNEKFVKCGIRYIKADIFRTGTNPLNDIKTFLSLKKILKEERPDKIFTYQAKTIIYGTLAARAVGIKEIYPLIAGVGSNFLSSSFKGKIVATILSTEYRYALSKCDTIFFQNNDDINLFKKLKIIKKQNLVILNGSGVNLEKFKASPLPTDISFMCISRLIKDKGVMEYLQAAQRVKKKYTDVKFGLVGPFDTNPSAITKQELQEYIDDGSVDYYGEQVDVQPFLGMCSVFVLPSYREGTPKAVLEAMAVGRAIITTDAPGCRETVTEGVNGCLVPVADIDELVNKIEYLIANKDVIDQMSKNSRKIAEEKYDVVLVNNKILKTMNL